MQKHAVKTNIILNMLNCLDQIIGLSETTCECSEEGRPEDYNVSKSGIFLDRLDGFNFNFASGSDDCQDGDLWARMATAVEDAKLSYKSDLLGCVSRFYQPRFNTFTGQLAQSSFKSTVNINAQYAGMKIIPQYVKGGFININKIGVIINQNAPVTVQIWKQTSDSSDAEMLFSSSPINAIADIVTWASNTDEEPIIELPMWDSTGNYVRYYVVMVLNGTFKPKNNKKDCGCGGGSKSKPYIKWLDFYGVYGDEILNPTTFKNNNDSVVNGITLKVEVKCKTSEIICSDQYPLDFENDGNALNMAYAIRFRAGVHLYESILSSDAINRFTLMNREHASTKIKEWSEAYLKYIEDTCKNSNRLFENDCLVCRDSQNTVIKRSIKV